MESQRRTELACASASVVAAAGIALFVEPLPPLLGALDSGFWTRGTEFLGLVLVFWVFLSALGFLRAKFAFGRDGLAVERLLDNNEQRQTELTAWADDLDVMKHSLDEVRRLLAELTSDRTNAYERRIGELEAQMRTLRPPEGQDV